MNGLKPAYSKETLLEMRNVTKLASDVAKKLQLETVSFADHFVSTSNHSDGVASRGRMRASRSTAVTDVSNVTNDENDPSDKFRSRNGISKYSPTPSIRRGAAEKLLKEHGSPPGLRVTAGGRIVPDSLSPLTSPGLISNIPLKDNSKTRYKYTTLSNTSAKHMNGFVVDVGNGNLCQIVDGELRPVEIQNGMLHLHMIAPNLPPMQPGLLPFGQFEAAQPQNSIAQMATFVPSQPVSTARAGLNLPLNNDGGPTARHIRSLEHAQVKYEQELKDLDRNEVLQRNSLTSYSKQAIVKARVELVNKIDEMRRAAVEARRVLAERNEPVPPPKSSGNNPESLEPFRPPNQKKSSQPVYNGLSFSPMAYQYEPNAIMYGSTFQNYAPEQGVLDPSGKGYSTVFGVLPLGERSVNSDATLGGPLIHAEDSTETVRTIRVRANGNLLGLDGSSYQPRRSHAIAIKNPKESARKPKSSLNPNTPSYMPGSGSQPASYKQDEFFPSPNMIAQVSKLVTSPEQPERTLEDSVSSKNRASESSMSTTNFFADEAHKHSTKKYTYDGQTSQSNLANWLTQGGAFSAAETTATPARIPNKFMFSDSPVDRLLYTNQIENPGNGERIVAAPELSQGVHIRETAVTVDEENSSIMRSNQDMSGKTQDYSDGFMQGLRQDLMDANANEDFRRGYRDGLLQSSTMASSAPIPRCNLYPRSSDQSPSDDFSDPVGVSNEKFHGLPKSTSFPSIGAMPHPRAPANSLSTTPTRNSVNDSHKLGQTLESPTAIAFMSKPNVNLSASKSRLNDQNIQPRYNSMVSDPPSPLAERSRPFSQRESAAAGIRSSVAVRLARMNSNEVHSLPIGHTSIAPSYDEARGQLARFDGNVGDGSSATVLAHRTDNTNSAKERARGKTQGSPIKAMSAALASVKQVAIRSPKMDGLENKQSKPFQPDKKERTEMEGGHRPNWRSKLHDRFTGAKNADQDDRFKVGSPPTSEK